MTVCGVIPKTSVVLEEECAWQQVAVFSFIAVPVLASLSWWVWVYAGCPTTAALEKYSSTSSEKDKNLFCPLF